MRSSVKRIFGFFQELPKQFLISFCCNTHLLYSINFKMIQEVTQSQTIIFAFRLIVIMHNAMDRKLVLFPEIEGNFALTACNFNIIRESDINSMFTFMFTEPGEDREYECFNSKLVIVFVTVSVSFDSLMPKSVNQPVIGLHTLHYSFIREI